MTLRPEDASRIVNALLTLANANGQLPLALKMSRQTSGYLEAVPAVDLPASYHGFLGANPDLHTITFVDASGNSQKFRIDLTAIEG